MVAVPRAPLAVSMGDPAGIGPEVVAKAWAALTAHTDAPPFFVCGLLAVFEDLGLCPIVPVTQPEDAVDTFRRGLPIIPLGHQSEAIEPGTPTQKSAFAALSALNAALHFVAQGLDEAAAKDAARGAIAGVWKGRRWYVTGQNDTSARNRAIFRDYQQGERPALLARRYGLTRQQIYKILAAFGVNGGCS